MRALSSNCASRALSALAAAKALSSSAVGPHGPPELGERQLAGVVAVVVLEELGKVALAVRKRHGDEFPTKQLEVLEKFPIEDPKAVVECAPKGEVIVYGPQEITEHGVLWMLKPRIPEVARLRCMDLGNECIHDALMNAIGVAVFFGCLPKIPPKVSVRAVSNKNSPDKAPPKSSTAARRHSR